MMIIFTLPILEILLYIFKSELPILKPNQSKV